MLFFIYNNLNILLVLILLEQDKKGWRSIVER